MNRRAKPMSAKRRFKVQRFRFKARKREFKVSGSRFNVQETRSWARRYSGTALLKFGIRNSSLLSGLGSLRGAAGTLRQQRNSSKKMKNVREKVRSTIPGWSGYGRKPPMEESESCARHAGSKFEVRFSAESVPSADIRPGSVLSVSSCSSRVQSLRRCYAGADGAAHRSLPSRNRVKRALTCLNEPNRGRRGPKNEPKIPRICLVVVALLLVPPTLADRS